MAANWNGTSTHRRLLGDIAWAHSGDKGDCVNLGVVARDPRDYALLLRQVTAERVREHFSDLCTGEVRRYELPNLNAINRVLMGILDGGPMRSLRMDPQGKTLGDALMLKTLSEELVDKTPHAAGQ